MTAPDPRKRTEEAIWWAEQYWAFSEPDCYVRDDLVAAARRWADLEAQVADGARVVVQPRCRNGRFHGQTISGEEDRRSCCDHWPFGDRSHPESGPCPTASFCDADVGQVILGEGSDT